MQTPRPVSAACALLAACLLLIVTACGSSIAKSGTGPGGKSSAQPHDTDERTPRFGTEYRFDSGIVVSVSEPMSFQPSRSAYPPADNAVAFELTVRNETSHRYRLSGISVTVTADRQQAKRVTDPTQGYTGMANTSNGLATEHETVLNLAFAVPDKAKHLEVAFTPAQGRPDRVTFAGRMPRTSTSAR